MLVRVYTYTLLHDVAGRNPLRRCGEEARLTRGTERPRKKKKDKEIAEEKRCEREEDEDGMESENARN